ncbi:alpha-mannosidase [Artemisia annua]|uniref:Alpha-mannosidase n=1 Tax=Artemisia annua TaxID=35608 RepID=A0A2U1QLI4_ARTAN|nr:alpha-mannosidase [Artemisia annua]
MTSKIMLVVCLLVAQQMCTMMAREMTSESIVTDGGKTCVETMELCSLNCPLGCCQDKCAKAYAGGTAECKIGPFNVTPRIGWQIDPFGHSAVQAYLLGAEVFQGFTKAQMHDSTSRRRLESNDDKVFVFLKTQDQHTTNPLCTELDLHSNLYSLNLIHALQPQSDTTQEFANKKVFYILKLNDDMAVMCHPIKPKIVECIADACEISDLVGIWQSQV